VQVVGPAHARLEHVCKGSPDVIVLGLALPDQSGLEGSGADLELGRWKALARTVREGVRRPPAPEPRGFLPAVAETTARRVALLCTEKRSKR
jgi:hypothetical protein